MLTDTKVRSIKPQDKKKKYFDRDGLYLLVSPTGKKYWKMKYSFMDKANTYSYGQYPQYSLQEARVEHIRLQRLLNEGKDPNGEKMEAKRKAKQDFSNTFYPIADEWFDNNKANWTKKHQQKVWNRLKKYAFPIIGNKPIKKIQALEILNEVIRPIEKNGLNETAHKLYGNIVSIFRFAVLTQRLEYNPIGDLGSVLQPIRTKHRPSIAIDELPKLLQLLDNHNTYESDKIAIKILLHCFVRPSELRKSKWEYVNFSRRQWVIPAELMKMKREHIVPLSNQVLKLLKQLYSYTGKNEYLLPTKNFIKHPYMNENHLNCLLKEIGYKDRHCAHGFRSLASTTLNELKPEWADVIEIQLAHIEQNQVRRAYNRAKYLHQREQLMQFWSDHIESLLDDVCL